MRKLLVVMVLALIMIMSRHARADDGVAMIEMQESADINSITEPLLCNKIPSEQVVDFGMLKPDTTPLAAALLEYDDELQGEINTAVDINHEVLEDSIATNIDTTVRNKKKRATGKFPYHPSLKDDLVSIDPEYMAVEHEVDEALAYSTMSHEFTEMSIKKLLDLIELEIALIEHLLAGDKDKTLKAAFMRLDKTSESA